MAFADQPQNIKTSGGRFQLIQLGTFRRDQFLLDTQTGKIWGRVCVKTVGDECAQTVWSLDAVEGITMSSETLMKKLKEAERAPSGN